MCGGGRIGGVDNRKPAEPGRVQAPLLNAQDSYYRMNE